LSTFFTFLSPYFLFFLHRPAPLPLGASIGGPFILLSDLFGV
jgi:hypothetical protein